MTSGFEKQKKKYLLAAVIKSVIVGVCVGLISVGTVLLALKLCGIQIHAGYYALIAIGAAILAGGISFLFLRPRDIRLARKIDEEYGLNEKVQTLITYDGVEGEMVELQRQDADERLRALPKRRLRFSRIWHYILISVLSIDVFVTAVALPAKKAEGPDPGPPGGSEDLEPKFEYTLYQQAAMAELIDNVQTTEFSRTEKEAMLAALYALDAQLRTVTLESTKNATVYAAVSLIDSIAANANSYRKISDKIKSVDEPLSKAILKGAFAFQSGGAIPNYDTLKSVNYMLSGYVESAIEEGLETSKTALRVSQSDGLGEKLKAYDEKTVAALAESGVEETDLLYTALNTFLRDLRKVSANLAAGGFNNDSLWSTLDQAYSAFSVNLASSLSVQSQTFMMDVFIRQSLAKIFGIALADLPKIDEYKENQGEPPGGDETPGDNPGGNQSGGYGDGNILYGSDDEIFDYNKSDYVKYGDVFDQYSAQIYEWILSSDMPDERKDQLTEYLNILLSGKGTQEAE